MGPDAIPVICVFGPMSMKDAAKGGPSCNVVVVAVVRTFPLIVNSTVPGPSRPSAKGI